jgi:hypothetical protein
MANNKTKPDKKEQSESSGASNKPRNLLITNATEPFTFQFVGRFGIHTSITVDQTADEDTWPGGALWDLGVLMAQLLVAMVTQTASVTLSTTSMNKHTTVILPSRLTNVLDDALLRSRPTMLELGCVVGLTGLVGAVALNVSTVLTDLGVVIDKVTRPNVEKLLQSTTKCNSKVIAAPLCWGESADEQAVKDLLRKLQVPNRGARRIKKKGAKEPVQSLAPDIPSIVLIGDVAYQQKPGAPSHFEALLSTLLQFVDEHTIVIFGTRIRMPASVDLLYLLLEHFEPVVDCIKADEIDASSFANLKHNMSIHFLRKKKTSAVKNMDQVE